MFPRLLVISRTLPRSEQQLTSVCEVVLQQQPTNLQGDIGAKEDDDDTIVVGCSLLKRHHSHSTLVNSSLKIFEYI
jgi:hypothetical protein